MNKVKKAQKDAVEDLKKYSKATKELLDGMIGATYSRHADLCEKDFLKEIGFENFGEGEEKAVNIATFNAITELTKQVFRLEGALKTQIDFMQELFKVNKIID